MPEHYTRQRGLWATTFYSVEEPPLPKPKSHKAHLHSQHEAATWGKDPWDSILMHDLSRHRQGNFYFLSPCLQLALPQKNLQETQT